MTIYRLLIVLAAALAPVAATGATPSNDELLARARALQKRIVAFDSHLDVPFDPPFLFGFE